MSLSRREFLKKSAGATAAASLANPAAVFSKEKMPLDPGPGNRWPGLVVLNYNSEQQATPKSGSSSDVDIIVKMMEDSIKLLANKSDVGEAWKATLPDSLTASSKIAIKVNSSFCGSMPTNPLVVKGIVEGLKQMKFNGTNYSASNITIWDGYNFSFSSYGFTETLFPDCKMVSFSRYSTQEINKCDFLINAPNIRGHTTSGFTIGFKSHYGTFQPQHSSAHSYLADYNCKGVVYEKTVLTVVSAIHGGREGSGPSTSWKSSNYYTDWVKTINPSSSDPRPNSIIISTDPVTAEFQAIKMMRIAHGGQYTASAMPSFLKYSAGMGGDYNIGIIQENDMRYGEIVNEEITINPHPTATHDKIDAKSMTNGQLLVFRGPLKKSVFLDFVVPESLVGKNAEITIVSAKGRIVRKLSHKLLGIRSRAVWNGTDTTGGRVAAGRYVIKAQIENVNFVKSLSIL